MNIGSMQSVHIVNKTAIWWMDAYADPVFRRQSFWRARTHHTHTSVHSSLSNNECTSGGQRSNGHHDCVIFNRGMCVITLRHRRAQCTRGHDARNIITLSANHGVYKRRRSCVFGLHVCRALCVVERRVCVMFTVCIISARTVRVLDRENHLRTSN